MTIKKTARAMCVAQLLVIACLAAFGVHVAPALKSGTSVRTLAPELVGVLWIAAAFIAVQRRARTDQPVARIPALACELALLVLGLLALLLGARDFGQAAIAAQEAPRPWADPSANSGWAAIPAEFADRVAAAIVWQKNTQRLMWVVFHASIASLVPSALSGLALLGFGEKARMAGQRFMLAAICCGVAAMLLAPMLIGAQIPAADLLASRRHMGLILSPMLIGAAAFCRLTHTCTA